MSIYENNLSSIKYHVSELDDKLMKYPSGDVEVVIGDAVNGERFLAVQQEDKLRLLGSMYHPSYAAGRYMDSIADTLSATMVIYGIGDGRILRMLLERKSSDEIWWIYEPSVEILRAVIQEFDLTDIFHQDSIRIYVSAADLPALEADISRYLNYSNWRTLSVISLPGYSVIFPEQFDQCCAICQRVAHAKELSEGALLEFAKAGLANDIYALRWLIRGRTISQMKNQYSGDLPCIIVAAGPSLEKNVAELQAAVGKACIICVDSAVSYLLANGIMPDYIGTVDGKKPLMGVPAEQISGIPMLISTDSNYHLLEVYNPKEPIYVGTTTEYYRRLVQTAGADIPDMDGGGSVATVCFLSALEMGFRTVIIVGQDLSYSGDHSHAGGNRDLSIDQYVAYEVEGYYGDRVLAREDFLVYIQWYNRVTALLGEDYMIINATEGGARLENMIQMPLRDAIRRYCTRAVDCHAVLDRIPEIWTGFSEKRKIYREFKNKLVQFHMIHVYAEECLAAANSILECIHGEGIRSPEYQQNEQIVLDRLSKIGAMDIYEILIKHGIEQYLQLGQEYNGEKGNPIAEGEKIFGPIRDHMEQLLRSAEEGLPLWEDTIHKINEEYHFEA